MKLPMKRIALLILDICLWSVPLVCSAEYPSWVETLRQDLPPVKIEQIRTDGPGYFAYPSPDGKWFAYVGEYYVKNIIDGEGAGGTLPVAISLYDKNGRFVREITYPRFYYIRDWEWSSSGNAIYFWVDPNWERSWSNGGLWKYNLRTKTYYHYWNKTLRLENPTGVVNPYATPHFPYLLDHLPDGSVPIFSPDGNSYITGYRSNNSSKKSLIRVWMKSGKRLRLAVGDTYNPKWSPEGRWISYENVSETSLWVVRSDGGYRRNLITLSMLGNKSMHSNIMGYWWIAGTNPKLIVLLSGNYGVWMINIKGMILKKISLPIQTWPIAGSMDGRHFYFISGNRLSNKHIKYHYYRITLEGGE